MPRYKIAPTKTNLFRIKREQEFAEEGYQLLEQKREMLVAELMSLINAAGAAQEKVNDALKEAYYGLEQAVVKMGGSKITEAAMAVNLSADISLGRRVIVGVDVPLINVRFKDNMPYYSLAETSFWLDETVSRFKKVVKLLGDLAQLKVTVLRIAREVSKTTRRVNVLEKIYLPDYKDTVKYILDVLEEQERETFFTLKLIKSRLETKKEKVK